MEIKRIIQVEDEPIKGAAIKRVLRDEGFRNLLQVDTAEKCIEEIQKAFKEGNPYDLLISDMHFDFFGQDDEQAGEKTVAKLRELGIEIPVIYCSSLNYQLPEAVACVNYNPYRNWEQQMREALKKAKTLSV